MGETMRNREYQERFGISAVTPNPQPIRNRCHAYPQLEVSDG